MRSYSPRGQLSGGAANRVMITTRSTFTGHKMLLKPWTLLFIFMLGAEGGLSAQQLFDDLSFEVKYSWVATQHYEQLQVVRSVLNKGTRDLDIPGQFLWRVDYIPDPESVKRMESKQDSVRQFFESERKAGRPHLHFRCGDSPEYPRLMNFQLPQEEPHLKLSAGETVRDTLLLDVIRSSYRGWPGSIQVDWQFGLGTFPQGTLDNTKIIPLDSLRLHIRVP